MLYDPKWEAEIKADPFSLEHLIAWLEKQPKSKRYCWEDTGACLCSQYFVGGGHGWTPLHEEFEKATGVRVDTLAFAKPHTFGAALKRARAALQATK